MQSRQMQPALSALVAPLAFALANPSNQQQLRKKNAVSATLSVNQDHKIESQTQGFKWPNLTTISWNIKNCENTTWKTTTKILATN